MRESSLSVGSSEVKMNKVYLLIFFRLERNREHKEKRLIQFLMRGLFVLIGQQRQVYQYGR